MSDGGGGEGGFQHQGSGAGGGGIENSGSGVVEKWVLSVVVVKAE